METLRTNKIIPRWEWRTFSDHFGVGEKNIKKYECTRKMESNEVYILSVRSGNNCKIRNDLLDIKILESVNKDSLEQWRPVMKSGFPINKDDIELMMQSVRAASPPYKRDEYTIEQFFNEIANSHPDLNLVNVFKRRMGWLIDEAIVEIADLTVDGESTRTVAVEHTDPELVINTVHKLSLGQFENINYIRGLKLLKGME